MHEAFDVVEVAMDASFDDAFQALIDACTSSFDENAERVDSAFFHVFDIGTDDGYFSVFYFVEGFDLGELKLFFDAWSAKLYLHVVSTYTFAFIDDANVYGYI